MKMDKTAQLYYRSAQALNLPATAIPQIAGFEVKLAQQRYFFRGAETPFNCASSLSIASNKYCMNKILESAGFPTPKSTSFNQMEFKKKKLEILIANFHFPLVVKPTIGTALGRDVICNIDNIFDLKTILKRKFEFHEFLTVEEFHAGLKSYRVLVFYNKVIGVVQRFPACVLGDGVHSINELIAITNLEREKLNHLVTLGPIKVDEECNIRLNEINTTIDSVPADKETVVLCYACNSSRGGTMTSLGKTICVENARLLCKAASALNLNLVGFDVACEDILVPIEKSRGVIIEANYNPDLTLHEHPISGIQSRVSKKIVQRLILRHPLAYSFSICQHKYASICIKSLFVISVFLVCRLLVRKII